jgi:hypothetical protein
MGKEEISRKPLRGRTVFLLASAVQFALTRVVSVLTLSLVGSASFHESGSAYPAVLGTLSKALYFPVITLALYPRGFFPGNWILVPIAANSLFWGLVIWGMWQLLQLKKRGCCRQNPSR